MAITATLVPLEIVNMSQGTARGPKYFRWKLDPDPVNAINVTWSLLDYGMIDYGIIVADLTPEQIQYLDGMSDTYVFPSNLDAIMPQGEQQELTNTLEGAYIPAQWLSGQITYREVLRITTGEMLLMQRLTTIVGSSPLTWGITLNTQYRNLTIEQQAAILQCYTEKGWNTSSITGNATMRQILKDASDQWATPIYLGGLVL
jgi:hypothetical protein